MSRHGSASMEVWVARTGRERLRRVRAPGSTRRSSSSRRYVACFEPCGRPLRPAPRRLRAGHAHVRGASRVRRAPARAARARRREPRRAGRAVRARALSPRGPGGDLARGRRRRSASTAGAFRIDPTVHPFCIALGDGRHPAHDPLQRGRPLRNGAVLDDARGRPRPLRARHRPRARRARRSAPGARRRSTSPRAGSGRTSSAARCRSGAGTTRACSRRSPTRSAA